MTPEEAKYCNQALPGVQSSSFKYPPCCSLGTQIVAGVGHFIVAAVINPAVAMTELAIAIVVSTVLHKAHAIVATIKWEEKRKGMLA